MCLINFRPKPDPEPIVPNRPIAIRPLSTHSSQLPPPLRSPVPLPLQPRLSNPAYQHISPRASRTSPRPSPRTSHHHVAHTSAPPPSHRLETIAPQPRPQPAQSQPQSHSQVVIIQRPTTTPRTSAQLSLREGEGFAYGDGPVMIRRRSSRGQQQQQQQPLPRQGARRSSLVQQQQHPHKRSGSLGYGADPRMSNASWRSTRERVVVVDEKGVRREYWR